MTKSRLYVLLLHVRCPIMTLNFKIRQSSIRPRASLILLNVYCFRLNIFRKDIFKRLFEKKDTLSENFGGVGADTLSSPLPPAFSRGPENKIMEICLPLLRKINTKMLVHFSFQNLTRSFFSDNFPLFEGKLLV